MNGAFNSTLVLAMSPGGPGEKSKGQIPYNFNNKVNFKEFLYQTLSVFYQIKRYTTYQMGFHSIA